jgi:hypothetical protein
MFFVSSHCDFLSVLGISDSAPSILAFRTEISFGAFGETVLSLHLIQALG